MIALWLSRDAIEAVGQIMYAVSFVASVVIAWRMFDIWRRASLDLAGGIMVLASLFAGYWLYCLLRIGLGCLTDEPIVPAWACGEMAWWVRLVMAVVLTAVAILVWRRR